MSLSSSLKFSTLAGLLILTFGCATKGYVNKQLSPVQSQIEVITDELVRMDQGVQDTRSAVQSSDNMAAGLDAGTSSPIYRTPSGFELPAVSIQKALRNAGYYQGNLDGKIGTNTQSAITSFQRDNGLETDGMVGRQTWSKLKVYLNVAK